MPALRERIEDITVIVNQLVEQINKAGSKHPDYISKNISEKGIKFILSQPWQGNIRELWSTLNRAFLWSDSQTITENDLASAMINRAKNESFRDVTLSYDDKIDITQLIDNYKKSYVLAALKASGNVKSHAAQMLNLKDHQTLSNWMKRLNIKHEK